MKGSSVISNCDVLNNVGSVKLVIDVVTHPSIDAGSTSLPE